MSAQSDLTANDRALLKRALETGRALEAWFLLEMPLEDLSQDSHERRSDIVVGETLATAFQRALSACGTAGESLPTRKLGDLASKVAITRGPKHLFALLVPIERLSGRSARDEEFLYSEQDGRDRPSVERIENTSASNPNKDSTDANASRAVGRFERIVACENIRSAFNVGAIFRTAETFAANGVWLAGYSPDPQKTAMGTDAIVPSRRFERMSDALADAKSQGLTIVAVENGPGAIRLDEFEWPEKAIVILGNERFGIDSDTLAKADHIVRIPTQGQKNSLNVGVAFGVVASAWRNQVARPQVAIRQIEPIGFLRGGFADPQVAPRQGTLSEKPARATVHLNSRFEGRPSNFKQALSDLDGFERAWLVFGFDRSQSWLPMVRPPRGNGEKRGVFATRAPHRPNGLGLTCVKILSVSEFTVEIEGHDLLEGTPIFDIKPYVVAADSFPNVKQGWLDKIQESAFSIEESAQAKVQLDTIEHAGEMRLRPFIREQLEFQPLDDSRKRITPCQIAGHYTIAFQHWRIEFTHDACNRSIIVREVSRNE